MTASVITADNFDWLDPGAVDREFQRRARALAWLQAHPEALPQLKEHYAHDPASFICDWGVTVDPRAPSRGMPSLMPFVLFGAQRELVSFVLERMKNREAGICEKSRDLGVSWVMMALAATLCLFRTNFTVLIGSNVERKVDNSSDPGSLFWKLRTFVAHLPVEFRGDWDEARDTSHMKALFRSTGSTCVGASGDSLGRGDRASIVIIDESAHLERPHLVDAALASTAEVRIDVSTPAGRSNSFAQRRFSGVIPVYTMPWHCDPRKTVQWYEKQRETLDPVVFAQEIDLSYDASTTGLLIPGAWIHSAIGARAKLGLGQPTGARRAGFDPADEGKDKSALALRHGSSLVHLESWSGRGSSIYKSTQRVFGLCDAHGVATVAADMDGMGLGVRGDGESLNEKRREAGKREIEVQSYRGSGAVFDPAGSLLEGVCNRDAFGNLKAQTGWALRMRFEATHRAVTEGAAFNEDDIIDIAPDLPELNQLISELNQPVFSYSASGKRVIDKAPDGLPSPNLFDCVAIAFSPFTLGGYFSGVRTVDSIAGAGSERAPPLMPMWLDQLFACLVISEDVAAVVYCGRNNQGGDGERGVALWVLDYDMVVLSQGADVWLTGLDDRLRQVQDETPAGWQARLLAPYLDDFEQGWANALRQLGVPNNPVGADLPPLAERFNKARPYVARELVALGPIALRKEVAFKGSRRNFLREVVTATAPPESNALALAFATVVLLSYHGCESIPTPSLTPEQFPRPPRAPPEPAASSLCWQTSTGVWHEGAPPEGHTGAVARRGDLGF